MLFFLLACQLSPEPEPQVPSERKIVERSQFEPFHGSKRGFVKGGGELISLNGAILPMLDGLNLKEECASIS